MLKLQAILGILVFLGFCYLVSVDRKNINYKQVAIGLALQFIIAIVVLNVGLVQTVFNFLNHGILAISEASKQGLIFVLGYLGGGEVPFVVASGKEDKLFILALQALPIVM